MATKRPTLADSGIDKLFRPTGPEPATVPSSPVTNQATEPPAAATLPPRPSWEDTHRRRTFHCPNATWERLEAWCAQTGTSRSAAIVQALEAFLDDQEKR